MIIQAEEMCRARFVEGAQSCQLSKTTPLALPRVHQPQSFGLYFGGFYGGFLA